MMVESFLPASAASSFAGSSSSAYFTQTVGAGVVFVFDFGFGERGLVVHAPVDGAQAFVDEPIFIK